MKVDDHRVNRGIRISPDAWQKVCALAGAAKSNVLPFAGGVLERYVGQLPHALPAPPWLDAWMAVPAYSRQSVRDSLRSDIAIFRENADVPAHVAGLEALLTILEAAEVPGG